MSEELYLKHYGKGHLDGGHSGRYKWGSGENPYQHDKIGFYKDYRAMVNQGKSETEIANHIDKLYFGGEGKFSTTKLRAWVTIGKEQETAANVARATELKKTGMSNKAIGEELGGHPESTVRTWLDPAKQAKLSTTRNIANILAKEVDKKKYLDVGKANEIMLNCSKQKLDAAIAVLEEEGYKKHSIRQEQQGNLGNYTWVQVLTKDDVTGSEVYQNLDKVKLLTGFQSTDGGETIEKVLDPKSISSDRVKIRYAEEGGINKDGVMEIRPGVKDLQLGNDQYMQVRIGVDGTHYLKGMAIYGKKEDFPKGVDIIFNTNKKKGTPMINKEDPDHQVLKTMKDDKDMPFGAATKTVFYDDKDGNKVQSCINKVNSDEDWDKWSKNLASQFLSKQYNQLAKQQLKIAYDVKENEFETIKSIDNPTIKKKLLEEFADECDSAAVHLKAAPLSGQATHVILPLNNIKDNEIYAPNYNQGEEVVLVRYPHAGPFESPRLKVNNRNAEGKEVLGQAKHAVGINAKVAEQLSGADFDGDTVVVLPVRGQKIKTHPPLDDLKDFDPKTQYKAYEGMKRVGKGDGFNKQVEMGKVSNLITDMMVAGAPEEDYVRAVKHSMVVIDAEKHNLNWKLSAQQNGIAQLKEKYQGAKNAGASTLLSKNKSIEYVGKRKEITATNLMTPSELKRYNNGEKIYRSLEDYYIDSNKKVKDMTDKQKKVFYEVKKEYNDALIEYRKAKNKNPNDPSIKKPPVPEPRDGLKFIEKERTFKSTKMAETKDARTLISKHNSVMENIYADYANDMKQLALTARKEARATPNMLRDPVAAKTYAKEVESIKNSIKIAQLNNPRERQAQMIAGKKMDLYIKANPDATLEDKKKKRNKLLAEARIKTGSDKQRVRLTDKEVEAVKAGAVSNATMLEIFNNGDQDSLKKAFTPKNKRGMTTAQISKAKRLLKTGYTQAEVAEALGVSVSSIQNNVM